MRHLEERIVGAGEISAEDVASAFSRAGLVASIRESRAAMRALLPALPDTAFEPQPNGPDGEPVWSAGEIAGHIAESMLWLQHALAKLAGASPPIPPHGDLVAARDRAATLAMLDVADRALDAAFDAAREIPDEARVSIDGLGNLGVRGLLLLHAMHEAAHASQLCHLGR